MKRTNLRTVKIVETLKFEMHLLLYRDMENDSGLPQRMTAYKTDKEYHDITVVTTLHADIEEIVDAFAAVRS